MGSPKDNEKDSPGTNNSKYKGSETSLTLMHLSQSKQVSATEQREEGWVGEKSGGRSSELGRSQIT